MVEKKAYTQAFSTGKYDKASGLLGKYDNVRRFWEDQLTGLFLRPALNDLVQRKADALRRLRILDMGCGSGDGFDLVMGVNTKEPGIYEYITGAVKPDMLQSYVGVDVNDELLEQAEGCFGTQPKMCFLRDDLSNGLPDALREKAPFDLYFTSYGTFSHFTHEQTVRLFADVFRHAPAGALLVGDWLGRHSYEWQSLWHHPLDQEYFMDYRISYIYAEEERDQVAVDSFPLRLVCREEVQRMVDEAAEAAGRKVRPVTYFDRSIFVGRHLETGDYNPHCPPLRRAVNSLFEGYTRTDLESLLVDYVPRRGFDEINEFFEMFFLSTNTLVQYTIRLLEEYDAEKPDALPMPERLDVLPGPLADAMTAIRRVIEGVGWLQWGDARANVIEPQLGYCLRKLEMELQPGTGTGHSFCGIFEVQ